MVSLQIAQGYRPFRLVGGRLDELGNLLGDFCDDGIEIHDLGPFRLGARVLRGLVQDVIFGQRRGKEVLSDGGHGDGMLYVSA